MRIAVLGAGAMGMLIGGCLSAANDVTLIDVNFAVVEKIQRSGVVIHEKDGSSYTRYPSAVVDSASLAPVDLMIVFVKAMYSGEAIAANRTLIGPQTYLMTLQNGAGHEETLLQFVDKAHVIIGTTQHNSSVQAMGEVYHGGSGYTYIGSLSPDVEHLRPVCEAFCAAGLQADCCGDVQRLIWEKLFTNVSASVLTAVLQTPLGYIGENASAWALCEELIREAVAVAEGDGIHFCAQEKIAEVRRICENSPAGLTSIYADVRDGRRSEVDTISGSVVRASRRNGIAAPGHELMVQLIHALEGRGAFAAKTDPAHEKAG